SRRPRARRREGLRAPRPGSADGRRSKTLRSWFGSLRSPPSVSTIRGHARRRHRRSDSINDGEAGPAGRRNAAIETSTHAPGAPEGVASAERAVRWSSSWSSVPRGAPRGRASGNDRREFERARGAFAGESRMRHDFTLVAFAGTLALLTAAAAG